jgi:hypothetical protein
MRDQRITGALALTAALAATLATLGCSTSSNGLPGAGGGPGGPGSGGSSSRGGSSGNNGGGGATMIDGGTCTPGLIGPAIVDCGYPYTSNSPLTSIVFNEDEVLRAIAPSGGAPVGTVALFYNDEHALTLGVREVGVKSASGTTTTDYPVSPLTTDPGSVTNPQTGTNQLVGDQSGLDASLRPMWPVLFITDITADPNSRSGDWQQGGRPINPNAVFGSWKAAVRTVDNTVSPATVTITPDADPAKNNWTLAGGDTAPAGLTNQGFGAEARWSVPIASGHSYRVQVMVHDGDQNKAGGDSGEACAVFCAGGGGGEGGASGTGGTGGASCPPGVEACGPGGVDPAFCSNGTVCANGCCLPTVP